LIVPKLTGLPFPYEIDVAFCVPRVTSKFETHRKLRETLPNFLKVGINMFYGGIDIAKYQHEVCIVNEGGNVILQPEY